MREERVRGKVEVRRRREVCRVEERWMSVEKVGVLCSLKIGREEKEGKPT